MTIVEVSYGTDRYQKMDVHYTAGQNRPIVMIVHGGGWKGGDKGSASSVTPSNDLYASGFCCCNVNYRLATPDSPGVPKQHNDLMSAVEWIRTRASTYGADPTKIAMLGGSAGAQLVALVGQLIDQTTPGRIRAIVPMSAPTDFPDLVAQAHDDEIGQGMQSYLGCATNESDPDFCTRAELEDPSPEYQISGTTPPMFITNSQNEMVPVNQAQDMHAAMLAAGRESELMIVPGITHGLRLWPDCKTRITAFLKNPPAYVVSGGGGPPPPPPPGGGGPPPVPTVDVGPDRTMQVGQDVTLTATTSSGVVAYEWSSTPSGVLVGTTVDNTVRVKPTAEGVYVVRCKVTDGAGKTAINAADITAAGFITPPVSADTRTGWGVRL